jgi:hypothetical protein
MLSTSPHPPALAYGGLGIRLLNGLNDKDSKASSATGHAENMQCGSSKDSILHHLQWQVTQKPLVKGPAAPQGIQVQSQGGTS